MIRTRLYNLEIESILRTCKLPYFKGVFSSDNIPTCNGDFVLVCNLSNEGATGSHFMCIGRIGKDVFAFDSLALNIANVELSNTIDKMTHKCGKMYTIDEPIQSNLSAGCGYYCNFFVLLYHKAKSGASIALTPFSSTLAENDDICIANINKMLQMLRQC